MENGLTKEHSAALHGLAIILMIYHHLFCIPSRLGCEYFSAIDWFWGVQRNEPLGFVKSVWQYMLLQVDMH